jgi:predicted kinase
MMKGLPASGKTTAAKKMVEDAPVNSWKRVNKDDLRAMLDCGRWSKGAESIVKEVRDFIVGKALSEGKNVVVDDTNLHPMHEKRLREIAAEHDATFHIKDLTDVPVQECIKRDKMRPGSVGEEVIRRMYKEFISPEVRVPINQPRSTGKPPAVIVDIDGTLATHDGIRGHHEYHRVGEDQPMDAVIDAVLTLHHNYTVLVVSGRSAICVMETHEWLKKNGVPCEELYMRPLGDTRKDSIIKREIYEKYIEPNYDVQFVLDDRDQVVEMWRKELRLPCFQVNYGNF